MTGVSVERIISRGLYIAVALLVIAVLAGLGMAVFFVLMGVVAVVAMYNAFRSSGKAGGSRDSAFDFDRDNYRMDEVRKKTVIETEYHEVKPGEEAKGS